MTLTTILAVMLLLGVLGILSWTFIGKPWTTETPPYDPTKPLFTPPARAPYQHDTKIKVTGKGGHTFVATGDSKSIEAVKEEMIKQGHKVK
jgi:hypothetical protein